MAYTPSSLTIDSWTVPISIVGTDTITTLDNTVNAIIDTDASSVKAHINTELAKIPTYLSTELTSMYNDLGVQINVISGLTATAAELNTLDGITSTTAELNKLDGYTGSVTELNYLKGLYDTGVTSAEFDTLDGITATTAELNIMDGVTATTAEINILDGVTATASDLNKTSSIPSNITSGTYTPTISGVSNISPSPSPVEVMYTRVGDVVTVSGRISITVTSSASGASFAMSLPIASNFSNFYELSGSIVAVNASDIAKRYYGDISADTVNDVALFAIYSNTTSITNSAFTFSYRVI